MEPPRQPGHVAALDGARGIAILLVVLVHAYERPSGGFLGVDVFFVLSGFLITTLLLRERAKTGRVSLLRFYQRRALRLLPALGAFLVGFAVLTTVMCIRLFGHRWSPHEMLVSPILQGAFYVSNVVQEWHGLLAPGIRQLWSLATEEQFYLLWPLTLVVLLRLRASPRTLVRVLVASIAAIAVARTAQAVAGVQPLHLYFAPEATFDMLLVGCLFAVWYVHGTGPSLLRSPSFRRVAWPLLLLGAAVQVQMMRNWLDVRLYEYVLPVFALEIGFLVFVAATDPGCVLARVLAARPLRYLGLISYSLYLWHPLVLATFGYPNAILRDSQLDPTTAVAVSIGFAILSYNFVEQPFLRRKRRYAVATVAPETTERADAPAAATPAAVPAITS
jgi:peptidoglycan/LPS O-acetylase OafA/YrhL